MPRPPRLRCRVRQSGCRRQATLPPPHPRCRQKHVVRTLSFKKRPCGAGVCEVQLGVGTQQKVIETMGLKYAHQSGAYEAAVAKLFSTEAAQRIVDRCLQVHGGNGVVKGAAVERLYRDVRALRIYEGASEVQRLVIARHLLG